MAEPRAAPPVARRDGLARLKRMIAGEEPPAPITGVLDFRLVEADSGRAVFRGTPRAAFYNPLGTVHGGVLATLVDTAMGAAVRSSTGDADVPATSQLTVTYLRPGRPGVLTVTAEVRKQGEHLTVCEADVEQGGKSLVHAVATFALLHG